MMIIKQPSLQVAIRPVQKKKGRLGRDLLNYSCQDRRRELEKTRKNLSSRVPPSKPANFPSAVASFILLLPRGEICKFFQRHCQSALKHSPIFIIIVKQAGSLTIAINLSSYRHLSCTIEWFWSFTDPFYFTFIVNSKEDFTVFPSIFPSTGWTAWNEQSFGQWFLLYLYTGQLAGAFFSLRFIYHDS